MKDRGPFRQDFDLDGPVDEAPSRPTEGGENQLLSEQ